MEKLFIAFIVAVLGMAPLMFFVDRRRKRRRSVTRSPFTDKLLRPAGESLRLELETLNEKFSEATTIYILTATFAPLLIFMSVPMKSFWPGMITLIVIEIPVLYFWGRKTLKLQKKLANFRLGFQGERAVGEELNQLLAEGCRIYHDLPFQGNLGEPFNIDHVILSPMGVFAVETKARNKSLEHEGLDGSRIIFDGQNVTMPWGSSAHGLEQARRNAQHLSQWLSGAIAERVTASPILTFPGWFIDAKGRGDVAVVNPKQIRHLVIQNEGDPARLSFQQFQQINHQLEQRCRDITER